MLNYTLTWTMCHYLAKTRCLFLHVEKRRIPRYDLMCRCAIKLRAYSYDDAAEGRSSLVLACRVRFGDGALDLMGNAPFDICGEYARGAERSRASRSQPAGAEGAEGAEGAGLAVAASWSGGSGGSGPPTPPVSSTPGRAWAPAKISSRHHGCSPFAPGN